MKRYLHVTGEGATPNSNRIPDGTNSARAGGSRLSWPILTRFSSCCLAMIQVSFCPEKEKLGLSRNFFNDGILGAHLALPA